MSPHQIFSGWYRTLDTLILFLVKKISLKLLIEIQFQIPIEIDEIKIYVVKSKQKRIKNYYCTFNLK